MNLYAMHSSPESLFGYDVAREQVPAVAWDTHKDDPDKLRKLKHLWVQSPRYSYRYALNVGNKFTEGEPAIATDAQYSFLYAHGVLLPLDVRGFPLGEPEIATDPWFSYLYAVHVLKDRFPEGEPTIRGSRHQEAYEEHFGIKL